jgi:non-heme chloroperoxidase
VLIGAIPPFLLQTDDNPEGVPREVFEGFKEAGPPPLRQLPSAA